VPQPFFVAGEVLMAITGETVVYRDGESELRGFLVRDSARDDRRPGILVVHGGAGLDDHAKGRAHRFADAGFVAFACDMYGHGVAGHRERVLQQIATLRSDRASLCRRARPAIDLLASHPQVDGRIAAVGYCLGGLVALELARSGAPLDGVVSVHGSLETSGPAEPAAIRSKVLVCHGALDPHVPMAQVTAFCDEMNRAQVDYQLIIYGGAMHGFTHETATGQQPGVAYHAPSDARSSRAIQSFFDEIFE
jgi:dienelactone hydrolase